MRKRTFLILSSLVVAATLLGVGRWAAHTLARPAGPSHEYDSRQNAGKLIVHEWGTFTSFSGSNGVRLDFRPLIDDDLPGFVTNRASQVGAYDFRGKGMYLVKERMETPVTYFYVDEPREVNVKVGFPKGLLTEFYPPVRQMLPAFERKNTVKVQDSLLDWGTVQLIPEKQLRTGIREPAIADDVHQRLLRGLLPEAYGDHYGFARETDSALVHVELPASQSGLEALCGKAAQGRHYEKFLFYRGIGNFELPIGVVAQGNGRFEVTNSGPDEIRSLFLVTADGTDKLRVAFASKLDPHGKLVLEHSAQTSTIGELSEDVVRALVGEQLYEKEARSMVKTWQTSWFAERGTRLFYIVPSRLTEELLPLTVAPAPDETVRVLVGRFEIMSPEDEAHVTTLVRESIAARAEHYKKAEKNEQLKAKGYRLPESILELGRLAEPALVRVRTLSKDQAVQDEASALLEKWRIERASVE